MTTKRFTLIVVSFVLLATSIVGCGIVPTPAPTATPVPTNTPEPTSTPTPTATPFGKNVVSLLLSNGFKVSEYGCEPPPCTGWETGFPGVIVQVLEKEVRFVFDRDYPGANVLKEAALMDGLLIPLYGQEVDSWIANNLKASQTTPEGITGTVNGFDVKIVFETNRSTCFTLDQYCKPYNWSIYRVTISPTGLATETPVPTPTTNPSSSVLLENGFVRNKNNGAEYYCNIPCEYYEHLIPDRADTVTLYNDGSFEMRSSVEKESDVPRALQYMATIATAIYGDEFGQWVSQQSEFPAHTTISGRKVDLTEQIQQEAPQTWFITLSIGPKTGN